MNNNELLSEFDKLYKQLAKLWHPDRPENTNKELATKRMQWLNALKETRDEFVSWLAEAV